MTTTVPYITVTINAPDAESLARLTADLHARLNPERIVTEDRESVTLVTSEEQAEPPKRKRGRPRKEEINEADPGDKSIQTEVEDEEILGNAADPLGGDLPSPADLPEAEPEKPAPKADAGAVSTLSAKEAREQAIAKAQALFCENPAALDQIRKIQAKYSIPKFQDCPDDKAHALLADVLLLVSGAETA